MSFPLLTILAVLPLFGAAVLLVVPKPVAKQVGLFFALATLVLGVVTVLLTTVGGRDFTETLVWIKTFGAHWALGPVDGLSLVMVLATVILVPFLLIGQWNTVDLDDKWSARIYFALVLVTESLALFAFLATDLLLFYIFFEATLIPMYFLIGGFGGKRRGYAAIKFLLFGLAGGLIMLAAVVGAGAISAQQGTLSLLFSDLRLVDFDSGWGMAIFIFFVIAFALKNPMVPFHTWLPDAAEEGTPGSSALLVGVLDKLGTFGMIRVCLEIFPEASQQAGPVMVVLGLISMIWGALAAIGQKNLMRMIAFTSVSHFGFIVIGIFSFTTVSVSGAMFYMFNHAFSTGILFLAAGFLVQRRGTAEIAAYGGVQKVAPMLAGVFLLGGLSSLALPGFSSFVSEFMVIAGSFARHPVLAGISTIGVVLAATYILRTYQRVFTGPVTDQVANTFGTDTGRDLSWRERFAVGPMVALLLFFGFFPQPLLAPIADTAATTMQHVGLADPTPTLKGNN